MNGNEMDYADFETEFPWLEFPYATELFSNFKGYVNALRIDKGGSGQKKYVPAGAKRGVNSTLFDFGFPFSGSEIPDLADEDVVLHNPGNEATPTVVRPGRNLALSVSGDLQTISGQEAAPGGGLHGVRAPLRRQQPDFAVAFDDEEVTIRSVFDHQDGALEVCYSLAGVRHIWVRSRTLARW